MAGHVFSVVATVVLAAVTPLAALAASEPTFSPHTIALKLVIESKADDVHRLDQDDADVDTMVRGWSVVRPIAPGVLDSTHWFKVSYLIDGVVKATWNVNTRTGEIGPDAFHGN